MTKNVGFAMGIEFREGSLQLNSKNEARVRPGMTFNVAVGLEDLEDKDSTDTRGQKCARHDAQAVVARHGRRRAWHAAHGMRRIRCETGSAPCSDAAVRGLVAVVAVAPR
jgi:hypothetical protein